MSNPKNALQTPIPAPNEDQIKALKFLCFSLGVTMDDLIYKVIPESLEKTHSCKLEIKK